MATASKTGPQDLPPQGGYGPIQTERIKLRTIIGARTAIGVVSTCTLVGMYLYYINARNMRRNEIEMRSSRFALAPLLYAERDRAVLKHMRRIRDEEADLMKDVEGWEVGSYFGEPIFKTMGEDEYHEPNFHEYVIHSRFEDVAHRYERKFNS